MSQSLLNATLAPEMHKFYSKMTIQFHFNRDF